MSSPDNSPVLSRPADNAALAAYRRFRWEHLRRPWGQPADDPDAAGEASSEHLVATDPASGEIVACGRLVHTAPGRGQIRSMAVAEPWRGTGLGLRVLRRLEALARGRGVEQLRVHAREAACGFYTRAGYADRGPGELLFGQIPHRWLDKPLDCHDFSAYGLQRRAAVDADGPAVAELVFRVLAGYGLAPEHDGIDRDLAGLGGFYAGGFFDLLEDAHGRLRGTVGVLRLGEQRGELRRMYLDPDLRRQGLGRACLGHALAWSRRAGIRALELETATVLHEARRLYEWAGFQVLDDGSCEARRCDLRMLLRDF